MNCNRKRSDDIPGLDMSDEELEAFEDDGILAPDTRTNTEKQKDRAIVFGMLSRMDKMMMKRIEQDNTN